MKSSYGTSRLKYCSKNFMLTECEINMAILEDITLCEIQSDTTIPNKIQTNLHKMNNIPMNLRSSCLHQSFANDRTRLHWSNYWTSGQNLCTIRDTDTLIQISYNIQKINEKDSEGSLVVKLE
jgi:hypothetical protein